MPTSELSNALNPYINRNRQQNVTVQYENVQVQYQPIIHQQQQQQPQQPQQPQPYIPHRSELEYAITERPVAVNTPNQIAQRQPTTSSVQAVHELLRMVAATRDSQEQEQRRRLEWEQQQEIKNAQRQAELERIVTELRQEVASLRGGNGQIPGPSHQSGLLTPHHNLSPNTNMQNHTDQPVSPVSPISGPVNGLYAFGREHVSDLHFPHHSYDGDYPDTMGFTMPQHDTPAPAPSITPSPSPQLMYIQPSMLHSESPGPAPSPREPSRKRTISTLSLSSEEEIEEDGAESAHSEDSEASRPKRSNHHDTRVLTINAAMRKHILRAMDVSDDKDLPSSHVEGHPLTKDDPVRFIWEKTSKQSVHNSRMKNRILEDIRANKKIYKHVPDKDFSKKTLESAFEQAFTTFRQKYRAQKDETHARSQKQRGDAKAQKSRRISRKKTKLSNRSEARGKLEAFAHVIFDGALQIECMSSEESDQEADTPSNSLQTRGYRWRSTRLLRFYSILDDEERADKSYKPKRGIGKKDRHVGPPKNGFHLPPAGAAPWMVSKRWIQETSVKFPDLPEALSKRFTEVDDFDWETFDTLGNESDAFDDEEEENFQDNYGIQLQQPHHPPSNTMGTGSSLEFALFHPS